MAPYSSIALFMLWICGVSLSESLKNGFSVELIHRDSPKSPFYRPEETHFLRVTNAVRRSFNRVNHFKKNYMPTNTPESKVMATDSGHYVMKYSVGTPPFDIFAIIDTGSDVLWIPCKPCKSCYDKTSPNIFDPSKSKTYKTLSCSSTMCQSLGARKTCSSSSGTCGYIAQYGDESKSQGDVSVETLTLNSSSGSSISFPSTMIGCAHDITENKWLAPGVVGLMDGPLSFTTQLSSSIQGKFSHCFVPFFLGSNISSKLNFGDAAIVSGQGTVSTPLIINPYYNLTLEAISVGNKKLDFGASSLGSSEGNIIIDSGTVVTYLPDDIYNKLESAVIEHVNLKRVASPFPPDTRYDSLCYEGRLDTLKVPVITAHFRGADVKLNAFQSFFQVKSNVACLAFATSKYIGINIYGSIAQHNYLIGYDLQKKIVSFRPADCTKQ